MPEHTKLCILYFCSAAHKKITEKKTKKTKSYMTAMFLPPCSFLFCYSFPKPWSVSLSLRGRSLTDTPAVLLRGASHTWVSPASVCSLLVFILHSQHFPERERELCLSGGGGWGAGDRWNVGMSERTGWRAGHVTPTLHRLDRSYYYSLHDEMAKSADEQRLSCPLCVMMSWDRLASQVLGAMILL